VVNKVPVFSLICGHCDIFAACSEKPAGAVLPFWARQVAVGAFWRIQAVLHGTNRSSKESV
jgi:hypothetical protein